MIFNDIKTEQILFFSTKIDPLCSIVLYNNKKPIVDNLIDIKIKSDNTQFLRETNRQWKNNKYILSTTKCYPLNVNSKKSIKNISNNFLQKNLTLYAETLSDIKLGSSVLFHKFKIGKVIAIHPKLNSFDVDLYVQPEYLKFLSRRSVFWIQNEFTVLHFLRSTINFDNFTGNIFNEICKNNKYILYPSKIDAYAIGRKIILHTSDANRLTIGTPIRYLGVDVGQIQNVKLITDKNEVQAIAVFYPKYFKIFARTGTNFFIIKPKISSFEGIDHLDTIFHPYINVHPGKGKPCCNFKLQESTIINSRYSDGLNIIVEASEAETIKINTPVFYRGLEVGMVTNLRLDTLSDRLMITLRIDHQYQHLVRNNSIFWLTSGYSLNFGLTQGTIKVGTLNQFIHGGIAFATPPGVHLSEKAQSGRHFLLQKNEPKKWREWRTILSK